MALNPKLNDLKFFPEGVSYNIVKLSALVTSAGDTQVTLITTKAPAHAKSSAASTQTIVYVDSGAVVQKTRVPNGEGKFTTDFTAVAGGSAGGVTTGEMNTAITNATKDLVTTEKMGTAITEATRDLVNTEKMNTAITTATRDLATTEKLSTDIANATRDLATTAALEALTARVTALEGAGG